MNTMSKFTRSLAPVVGGLLLLTAAASAPAASEQVVTSTLRIPLQDTVRYRSPELTENVALTGAVHMVVQVAYPPVPISPRARFAEAAVDQGAGGPETSAGSKRAGVADRAVAWWRQQGT